MLCFEVSVVVSQYADISRMRETDMLTIQPLDVLIDHFELFVMREANELQ